MKNKKGSALLLATILLFVVLSMVVSLSYVTVVEQQMSSKTKSSVGSFFKADSGVEWALNKISNISGDLAIGNSSAFNDSNIADGVACPEGFGCTLYFLDENGKVITTGATSKISDIKAVRSVGTQTTGDPTQRAIEAAVAAASEPPYDLSCFHAYDNVDYQNCCQINKNTGEVKCRAQKIGSSNPWYDYFQKPWSTGTSGHYNLSCWAWPDESYQFCCRMNADDGTTECKVDNGSGNPWSSMANPF